MAVSGLRQSGTGATGFWAATYCRYRALDEVIMPGFAESWWGHIALRALQMLSCPALHPQVTIRHLAGKWHCGQLAVVAILSGVLGTRHHLCIRVVVTLIFSPAFPCTMNDLQAIGH